MFKKREKKTTIFHKDEIAEELNNAAKNKTEHDKTFLNKKRASQFTVSNNFNSKTNGTTSKDITKELVDGLKYQSTEGLHNVNYSTRELEIDTEQDRDAKAINKRKMEISKDILEGKLDTNVYRGNDTGVIYLNKSEKDMSRYKVTGSLGPMRAPTNLRVNCRFDYAPGICKDYKETGFCGFGDSCVFMHDRGDYKTGWELEEEWRREQKQKQKLIQEGKYKETSSDEDNDSDDPTSSIPLICPICDKEYITPVKTVCEHYFCESCALKNYSKSSACYVCRKPTQGIFNYCETLIELIKRKRSKRKGKSKPIPDENITKTTDDGEAYMPYLDNRDKLQLSDSEDEIKVDKKKKNKFKTQNSWLYESDYKSYI
jgi:RING finger protein 113A